MYKTEDILDAARAIRPELERLLGPKAEAVASELDNILARPGADADIRMLDLLGEDEATDEWMSEYLDGKEERPEIRKGYQHFGGNDDQGIDGILYVCPEPNCTTRWTRYDIDEDIPECPEHRKPLTEKS